MKFYDPDGWLKDRQRERGKQILQQIKLRKMEGFHWENGTYFTRMADGSVRIRKMKTGHVSETEVEWEITIPQHSWASIVSSVSAGGEINGRFYEALSFHGEVKETVNA